MLTQTPGLHRFELTLQYIIAATAALYPIPQQNLDHTTEAAADGRCNIFLSTILTPSNDVDF